MSSSLCPLWGTAGTGNVDGLGRVGKRCGGIAARSLPKAHKSSHPCANGPGNADDRRMNTRELLRRPGFRAPGLHLRPERDRRLAHHRRPGRPGLRRDPERAGDDRPLRLLEVRARLRRARAHRAHRRRARPRRSLPVALRAPGPRLRRAWPLVSANVAAVVVLAAVAGARGARRARADPRRGRRGPPRPRGAAARQRHAQRRVLDGLRGRPGRGRRRRRRGGHRVHARRRRRGPGSGWRLYAALSPLPLLVVADEEAEDGWWTKLSRAHRPRAPRAASLARLFGAQAVLLVFFTMIPPIEVVYAREELGATAAGLGALMASWGVGAIAGSAVFARVSRLGVARCSPSAATAAIGVSYLGMGLAGTLPLACVLSVVGGVGNGMQWIAFVTAVQERTPSRAAGARDGAGRVARRRRSRASASPSAAPSPPRRPPASPTASAGAAILAVVAVGAVLASAALTRRRGRAGRRHRLTRRRARCARMGAAGAHRPTQRAGHRVPRPRDAARAPARRLDACASTRRRRRCPRCAATSTAAWTASRASAAAWPPCRAAWPGSTTARFDIARHVHARERCPPRARPGELRDTAGALLSRPLDPARPLWRMYLVERPGRRRVRADRAGAPRARRRHRRGRGRPAALRRRQRATPPSAWRPQHRPSAAHTLGASAGARLAGGARAAATLARAAAHPARRRRGAARRGGRSWATLAAPAPATALDRSLTAPAGGGLRQRAARRGPRGRPPARRDDQRRPARRLGARARAGAGPPRRAAAGPQGARPGQRPRAGRRRAARQRRSRSRPSSCRSARPTRPPSCAPCATARGPPSATAPPGRCTRSRAPASCCPRAGAGSSHGRPPGWPPTTLSSPTSPARRSSCR